MSQNCVGQVMTVDLLKTFRTEFQADPVANLAMNACMKSDPIELCVKREKLYETNHAFSHKIEQEGKPVTQQKSSGRCWIFACLNAMRVPFMKAFNLEEFEFSQTYLFVWDKIERCNYFLNKIAERLAQNEPVEGRLISYLLNDPTTDGGQWDMLVNLITKYGLMPKKNFPETYCSENSLRLNRILESKLREYTRDIHRCISNDAVSDSDKTAMLGKMLQQQMKEIYRVVSICLGLPPAQFTWEFCDKNKKYNSIGPVTPLEFYKNHVKPIYDVENKVCLVNDPRPNNVFRRTFTVDCLGNMVEGRNVVYNNQPIEVLMQLASQSIKAGEPVWFGCEMSKRLASKLGIHDPLVHDYRSVFGLEVNLNMSKAERLLFGDSLMTHAMVFTAVSVDDGGAPVKWRVENSWGEDRGEKGYHVLTSDWFREFVFEVVVDRGFVPDDVMQAFENEPIVLPAWDPMGSLA